MCAAGLDTHVPTRGGWLLDTGGCEGCATCSGARARLVGFCVCCDGSAEVAGTCVMLLAVWGGAGLGRIACCCRAGGAGNTCWVVGLGGGGGGIGGGGNTTGCGRVCCP